MTAACVVVGRTDSRIRKIPRRHPSSKALRACNGACLPLLRQRLRTGAAKLRSRLLSASEAGAAIHIFIDFLEGFIVYFRSKRLRPRSRLWRDPTNAEGGCMSQDVRPIFVLCHTAAHPESPPYLANALRLLGATVRGLPRAEYRLPNRRANKIALSLF